MRIPQDLPQPLEGTYLVEASAGTGKTETLSDIVLFLVAAGKRPLNQILVVTFTEAATEELKGRILQRFQNAIAFLDQPNDTDERLAYLSSLAGTVAEVRARLDLAVRSFDEAAIFTIHGFCHKVLRENAFESGFLFNLDLSADEEAIVQEIVDDFWRLRMAALPKILIHHLHAKSIHLPDALAAFVAPILRQARLDILLPEPPPALAPLEREALSALQVLVEIWSAEKERIRTILLEDPGLNRRSYGVHRIPGWIEETDHFLEAGDLLLDWPNRDKFCADHIVNALKKGCEPPRHPFFDACSTFSRCLERLQKALETHTVYFKKDLVDFVRGQLKVRKAHLHIRSFDDLLNDFCAALHQGSGLLAQVVREKFPVALVDEFQDTDPVQYEIFRLLYAQPGFLLFLIGDPKQAIYSFRGADIFTYMGAGRQARKMRLDRNWRSAPQLVNAINTLFKSRNNPFVFDDIEFEAIDAGRPDLGFALEEDGRPARAPLRIWFFQRPQDSEVIDRQTADRFIPAAVAAEISDLLGKEQQGRTTLDGRPLAAADMAVIVRKNREALLIRDALRKNGIPAVIYSNESLFATREAADLLRLLKGIADPANERVLRTALTGSFFGLEWAELYELFEDEGRWEATVEKFHAWHSIWQEQGFIAMAAELLRSEKIRRRLLSRQDGERRLTNLIHCLEILHHTAATRHLGVRSLLKWFRSQVEEQPEKEEYQLRLETDRQAVNVITVHRSKGLGFPVVFCPYSWDGLKTGRNGVFFHDPKADNCHCFDMGSPDMEKHKDMMEKEELAENMRLLYVALTRARYRCYLVWGAFKGAQSSALSYLLHTVAAPSETGLNGIFTSFRGRSDEELLADMEKIADRSGGNLLVTPPPEALTEKPVSTSALVPLFEAAEFSGRIETGWELASFTSLARGAATHDDNREKREEFFVDEAVDRGVLEGPAQEITDIFSFPHGVTSGLCLHAILEKLDYRLQDRAAVRTLVQDELRRYRFDAERWTPVILTMLEKTVRAVMPWGGESFCLADVDGARRLTEMEFHFPIKKTNIGDLMQLIGSETLTKGRGRSLEASLPGYLKGFIDLVFEYQDRFFLVDWKSNFLGDSPDDYGPENLQQTIQRDLYHLQYHLYCLALHKYLRTRLPEYDYERHFGSVYYFFLRGVDSSRSPAGGIYAARPDKKTIEGLELFFQNQ